MGLVVFVVSVFVSAWNMRLSWTDGRRWPRRIWSVLVFASTLLVLYVALRFGLIALTVNY